MRLLLALLLVVGMVGCLSEREPSKTPGKQAASPAENAATATTADSAAVVGRLRPAVSRVDIVLESVKPLQRGDGSTRRYGLTRNDFRRLARTIPTIQQTVPVRISNSEVRHGTETVAVRVVESTRLLPSVFQVEVSRGRFLTDKDRGKRVAVIGPDVAHKLYPDKNPLGMKLRMDDHLWVIVGQMKVTKASDRLLPRIKAATTSDVYVPLSMMRAQPADQLTTSRPESRKTEEVELSQIWITVAKTQDVDETVTVIKSLLGKFHKNKDYSITLGTR